MQPSFQQIAELFQLSAPTVEEGELLSDVSGLTVRERGARALSEGKCEAAIRHFKRAIEEAKDRDPQAHVDLAAAYEYGDYAPQALRQYLVSRKLATDQPESLLGIADLYKRYGKYRDALESAKQALDVDPSNPFLHYKLGDLLRTIGERPSAYAAIARAIVLKPDDPFYHYWCGDLLIEMGRYEEALDSFRAAIELSPGDDHLYIRAAVAFWRLGRRQEGVKSVRLASDLDPSKHIYHGLLEALLGEMGLTQEANLEATRADQMDRYDHDLLARISEEMGL